MTEENLQVSRAARLELQRDELSVVCLPEGQEIDFVQVDHVVHVDQAILALGGVADEGAILVCLSDGDLEVR